MDKDYFNGGAQWSVPSESSFRNEQEDIVVKPRKEPSLLIHLVLFISTVVTTLIAGALQQGVDLFGNPQLILIKGLPFSASLLFILLSHEMGHYLISRKNHVDATLPYFIPAPNLIGTFGAVIRMRSPVYSKKILFDIGVTGPLAGVVVTLPILVIGLAMSEVKQLEAPLEGEMMLGTSLILSWITQLMLGTLPENCHIILHPLGFAGWIGLLVTSLNLMPVGQLDGGHISYAIFGRKAALISRVVIIGLLVLGIWGATMWLFWALLLIVLLGMKHPPPLDHEVPLDTTRKVLGTIMLLVFIITFIPFPFGRQ